MMTEARLILPVNGNGGEPLEPLLKNIRAAILRHFGGYTRQQAEGAWRSPSGRVYAEPVEVYTIAGDWTQYINLSNLTEVAEIAARMLDQEAIYLSVNGEVHFISPAEVITRPQAA